GAPVSPGELNGNASANPREKRPRFLNPGRILRSRVAPTANNGIGFKRTNSSPFRRGHNVKGFISCTAAHVTQSTSYAPKRAIAWVACSFTHHRSPGDALPLN